MSHTTRYSVALGDRGRLVLPAPLRRQLGLVPGDRLMLTVDSNGVFHGVSAREQAARLYGLYQTVAPERLLVDELLAERRAEVQADEQL